MHDDGRVAACTCRCGTVLPAAVAGAVLGAQTGYLIGRQGRAAAAGPPRAAPAAAGRHPRPGARSSGTAHGKAIVLARFIPLVRTVLNPLAGTVGVPVRTFTFWQVLGGVVWSAGVTLAGYALGSRIPNVDAYLLPIIAVIVVLSLIPVLLELRRSRSRARAPEGTSP